MNEEQVIALREEMAANNKEHEAFNRRLKEHDQKLGQLNELTLAISRLTDANVNVTRVLEQVKGTVQRLDTRLESIEHEPGEKWKKITFEIIKYLVLAAVGMAAGYFIKGSLSKKIKRLKGGLNERDQGIRKRGIRNGARR